MHKYHLYRKLFCTFILLSVFLYHKFSYSQKVSISPIIHTYQYETKQKGYQHIYALHSNKNNTISIATDRGIFEFNGTEIIPKTNMPHADFVNFFEDDIHLWALPYLGFVQDVNNSHQKLDLFNNEPYQCFVAYLDKNYQPHFLIYFKGQHYEAIKKKNSITINKLIDYMNFYENFINANIINSISNANFNRYFKGKTEIRIKNSRYLMLNETCYDIFNNKIALGFDGIQNGFNGSTMVDKVSLNKGGFYMAYMGTKKGLYYVQNNVVKPIYIHSNVNAVAVDSFGQIYFTDASNKLYQIKNVAFKQYQIPIEIKKCVANKNSVFVHAVKGNVYQLSLTNPSLPIIINNTKNGFLSSEKNVIQFNNEQCIYEWKEDKSKNITNPLKNKISSNSKKYYTDNTDWQLLIDKKVIEAKHKAIPTTINIPDNIVTSNRLNTSTIELGTTKGIYHVLLDSSCHLQKINTSTFLDNEEIKYYAEDSLALYYYCESGIVKHDLLKKTYTPILTISPKHPFYDLNNLFFYNQYLIGVNQYGFVSYHTISQKINQLEFLEHNVNEILKDGFIKDSSLYFYSTNNIYTLPLNFLYKTTPLPTIIFNDLQSNLKTIAHSGSIATLSFSNKNNSTISFNAFNNHQNEWNAWHYTLQKNNEQTSSIIPFEKYQISLNNLEYGTYRTNIYFNNQLVGNYIFNLQPHFYQRTFFLYSILSLLMLCMLYILYRILKHKNQLKINEILYQHYVANLETSSKLNQLKPHFVFNALMPLQNLILKKDVNNAMFFLKQFSTLLRQMLNMSRDNYTSLEQEINFLENYLAVKHLEQSKQFTYSINYDQLEAAICSIKIPTLLIQPLLENAIQHGLKKQIVEKPFIICTFSLMPNQLLCVQIADSGKGFEITNELNKQKNNALYIIHERLELMKKQTHIHEISMTAKKINHLFTIELIIPIIQH